MSDKHGHKHHGKSSKDVLSAETVLEKTGLKVGDTFLDAGCGDGYISIAASSIVGKEGKVHALDVYEESIDKVKKQVQDKGITNIEAKVADLTQKLPLKDNSIDVGVMANVMHGFVAEDEVEEVMNEIRRVVKPEGIFALVEFKKIESVRGPSFEVRISPSDVEGILNQYGFEVLETVDVSPYHYLVSSIKKD